MLSAQLGQHYAVAENAWFDTGLILGERVVSLMGRLIFPSSLALIR